RPADQHERPRAQVVRDVPTGATRRGGSSAYRGSHRGSHRGSREAHRRDDGRAVETGAPTSAGAQARGPLPRGVPEARPGPGPGRDDPSRQAQEPTATLPAHRDGSPPEGRASVMNRPPVAPTRALLPASAPHAQVHAFGAPWANVGALVALVGKSELA